MSASSSTKDEVEEEKEEDEEDEEDEEEYDEDEEEEEEETVSSGVGTVDVEEVMRVAGHLTSASPSTVVATLVRLQTLLQPAICTARRLDEESRTGPEKREREREGGEGRGAEDAGLCIGRACWSRLFGNASLERERGREGGTWGGGRTRGGLCIGRAC